MPPPFVLPLATPNRGGGLKQSDVPTLGVEDLLQHLDGPRGGGGPRKLGCLQARRRGRRVGSLVRVLVQEVSGECPERLGDTVGSLKGGRVHV